MKVTIGEEGSSISPGTHFASAIFGKSSSSSCPSTPSGMTLFDDDLDIDITAQSPTIDDVTCSALATSTSSIGGDVLDDRRVCKSLPTTPVKQESHQNADYHSPLQFHTPQVARGGRWVYGSSHDHYGQFGNSFRPTCLQFDHSTPQFGNFFATASPHHHQQQNHSSGFFGADSTTWGCQM